MEKRITIIDVAEALGVSKTTVSRAISGKGRVGNETRERVLQYIKENDYKPNVIAQGLAKSRTYNIGVVIPTDYCLVDLTYFQNCLSGIHEIASELDYDILMIVCDNKNMNQLERIVSYHKVDGVILMRTFVHDRSVQMLTAKKIPFVTIGSSDYENVIQVDQNHVEACKELTSILLMKDLKRIALIGGRQNYVVTRQRFRGYEEAYRRMNLSIPEELIYMDQEETEQIEAVVQDILEKKADCILCMNDHICAVTMAKLEKENISIPLQMKVASFFHSQLLEHHIPSVTSVMFNVRELGMVAGRTLIDRIENRDTAHKTLLGYEVMLKESTR